jgi:hypothetical protein
MAKRKTATAPRAKRKVVEEAPDHFDEMTVELESMCDVSFNKRYNLFLDKRPYEVRLCSVDASNILAYFFRSHATRDCEYLSQSSLMHDLVSTGDYPNVTAFIKRHG